MSLPVKPPAVSGVPADRPDHGPASPQRSASRAGVQPVAGAAVRGGPPSRIEIEEVRVPYPQPTFRRAEVDAAGEVLAETAAADAASIPARHRTKDFVDELISHRYSRNHRGLAGMEDASGLIPAV